MYLFLLRTEKVQNMQKKALGLFLLYPFFVTPPPVPPFSLSSMYDQSCPPEKKDFKKNQTLKQGVFKTSTIL
jgi:hypothetical protein